MVQFCESRAADDSDNASAEKFNKKHAKTIILDRFNKCQHPFPLSMLGNG